MSFRRSSRIPARAVLVSSFFLAALLVFAGCGGDDDGSATADTGAVEGTSARLDLGADLSQPESFYDIPYPSDLRLDDAGRARHGGFPSPPGHGLLGPVLSLVDERRFWPVTPFAFFRFDAPLASRRADDWILPDDAAPVLLIGVDTDAADYARLYPTVASTPPADAYVPEHFLAVSVPPGVVLQPSSRYAFVVLRELRDLEGRLLGVPESFARLRAGQPPSKALGARAEEVYAPLWPALRDAGVDLGDVAAATIFTTGDVVADLKELSDAVRARHSVEVENLRVDPDDGAGHEHFCELHGEVRMPIFQRGMPNYNTDGRIDYDGNGLPIVQREEVVPIAMTLPRTPMPEGGYTAVLYFHGTSGTFEQVVDRGAAPAPNAPPAKGEGPAHVVGARGLATVAAALPLNPDRYDGPLGLSARSYLNLNNLAAYPDTFRQMSIEQRLLLDALGRLEIAPELGATCGLEPLGTGTAYRVRNDRVFALGQSLGGQIANMVGALDPRVVAVVPTGSGGHWSLTTLTAEFAPGVEAKPLIALILGVPVLRDHLHPALQLIQSGFEAAEPLVYATRLALNPLPGHAPRSIYQPIGIDDPGFPNVIYAAMALASGTQQAGDDLDATLPRTLALYESKGRVEYPTAENRHASDGTPYTAVVVQYEGDGILSSHSIFAQLDAVKYQYGCFLESAAGGGPAVVPAPRALSDSCPQR